MCQYNRQNTISEVDEYAPSQEYKKESKSVNIYQRNFDDDLVYEDSVNNEAEYLDRTSFRTIKNNFSFCETSEKISLSSNLPKPDVIITSDKLVQQYSFQQNFQKLKFEKRQTNLSKNTDSDSKYSQHQYSSSEPKRFIKGIGKRKTNTFESFEYHNSDTFDNNLENSEHWITRENILDFNTNNQGKIEPKRFRPMCSKELPKLLLNYYVQNQPYDLSEAIQPSNLWTKTSKRIVRPTSKARESNTANRDRLKTITTANNWFNNDWVQNSNPINIDITNIKKTDKFADSNEKNPFNSTHGSLAKGNSSIKKKNSGYNSPFSVTRRSLASSRYSKKSKNVEMDEGDCLYQFDLQKVNLGENMKEFQNHPIFRNLVEILKSDDEYNH